MITLARTTIAIALLLALVLMQPAPAQESSDQE
jgi:hypothetical protein